MDDWEKLKAELLEDPATREAYEARRPAYEIATKLIQVRHGLGMSQRQLAAKAGMTQPEIARLESGHVQPTWETISRVLGAVGAEIDIKVRNRDGKVMRISVASEQRVRERARRPANRSQKAVPAP